MKLNTSIVFITAFVLFAGCSPRISSNLTNPQPELSNDEKVALLDLEHQVPANALKVGELSFQDSGFSTDCSFNSLMTQARNQARKNGANLVKVTSKKNPDLWSSCYRLKMELYNFEGDVSALSQYQIKLD